MSAAVENEPVVTKANEDRRFKLCQCGQCSLVARCLPTFDFYSRGTGSAGFRPGIDGKPDSPIYCAYCTLDGQR